MVQSNFAAKGSISQWPIKISIELWSGDVTIEELWSGDVTIEDDWTIYNVALKTSRSYCLGLQFFVGDAYAALLLAI